MKTTLRSSRPKSHSALLICSLLLFGCVAHAQAASTRTWDGGGASGFWTNRFNWVGDIAPVTGDNLVFPPVTTTVWRSTNNFPSGTAWGSILLTGTNYFIVGNPILLTGGVSSQCPAGRSNTLVLALTLDGEQTIEQLNASAHLYMPGHIDLNGNVLTLGINGGYLHLGGAISGAGQIRKTGTATVELLGSSANTYSGGFTVLGGTLRLNKSAFNGAIPGPLTNAAFTYLTLDQSDQIANTAPVVLSRGSGFYLLNHSDYIGGLFMTGAEVDTGTGTLSLNVACIVEASDLTSTIAGNLRLNRTPFNFDVSNGTADPDLNVSATVFGGVHVVKSGAGQMHFQSANSYTGTTTVNEGRLYLYDNQALGTTASGTTVNSNANLYLVGVHVGAEPLALNTRLSTVALYANGTSSWSGPVTIGTNVSLHSDGTMTFSNALSGPGSIHLTGQTFEFAGNVTNTYAGDTTVMCRELRLNHASGDAYAIPGELIIGGGAAASNVVRLIRWGQMPDTANVTLLTNGVLNLNGEDESLGGLTFAGGRVDTGFGLLSLNANVQFLPSDRVAQITGQLSLRSATRIFSVEDGPAYPSAQVYADLSGSGGLTWKGTTFSTVMVRGSNSYGGLTTITNLRLYVYNSWSLGSTNGSTLVQDRSDLWLVNAAITNETVTLESGAGLFGNVTSLWSGPVILAGNASLGGNLNDFEIRGPISGSGDLYVNCTGVIRFSGSQVNSYLGTTYLNRGSLELDRAIANAAIPGPLVIGSASFAATNLLLGHNQIANASAVTVEAGSLLDLNGFSDTIGPLTLEGARVETGTGTLRLNGNVTVANTDEDSVMRGIVDLWGSVRSFNVATGVLFNNYASIIGTGQLVKEGRGWMLQRGSNNYAGLTVVADGILDAIHPFALGQTNSGTVVSNGATLYLTRSITNEALTLNGPGATGLGALHCDTGTNTWTGPIALNADSTIYVTSDIRLLNLIGPIEGPGGLTKLGGGPARLGGASANTYAGTTRVSQGTLELNKSVVGGAVPGTLWIGDGVGDAGTDVVRLLALNQINGTASVILTNSGLLDLADFNQTVGSVSGSGRMELGSAHLNTGANGETTLYSGLISGLGGRLTKSGSGRLTLTANNTYSGQTIIQEGGLLIGGTQPASSLQVNVFGTLLGTGTVGHLTNFGIINPGASPGGLFASNVVIASGAGVLAVEIEGATSDKYDRLNARGAVDVTGGKLWLNVSYPPTEGDQFLIVNNLGASPVVGTFTGLAEGALLTTNGLAFRVSYVGGDGNDIILTFTNTSLRLAGWQVRGGNGNNVIEPNECDQLWLTLSNLSATPIMGLAATLTPLTPGVLVTRGNSAYPSMGAGVAVAQNEPFQISTLPGFICGTNVELLLAVQTTTHGAFNLPVTLPSGAPGWGASFGDDNPRAIPDGGSITSTVNAASYVLGPLVNVQVSLFISHSYDADLDLYLEAPDGTRVELSTDNGGSGDSYGVSCAGSPGRTWFADDASLAITAGSAPFTNYYRPETPFAVLRGKSGPAVAGTWKLIVRDATANGFTGALNCWSLYLFGPACADGGGPCESCPDRTLYGTLGPLSSTHINHLTRDGVASTCAAPKMAPLPSLAGSRHYQTFTFLNGESNACVTVTLTADAPLFSAAYLDRFDPGSLRDRYLGDLGRAASNNVPATYAVNLPALRRFVVVVEETVPGSGGTFVLDVRGGSCRPVLGIRPEGAGRVVLDWTTAAPDYQLKQTNRLTTGPYPAWPLVPGLPVVVQSRFQVTNTVTAESNRFYRLEKH